MEREHNLIPEDALWKRFLYRIIYRSDTKLGKLFDIILLSLLDLDLLFFDFCEDFGIFTSFDIEFFDL